MLPFLHGRVQQLDQVLARSSEVFAKYSRLDLDLAPALEGLLDEAIAMYHGRNDAKAENELLALKAEFVAAEQGINPLTLERITDHRRQVKRAIFLRVLQQCALVLRNDAQDIADRLAEAELQLRPITLLAIRKELVAVDARRADQAELDALWKALVKEPDIALAARQVAMQISPFDILLLLGELLATAGAAAGQEARDEGGFLASG